MISVASTPKRSNPEPTGTNSPVKKLKVKEYELTPPKRYRRKEKKALPPKDPKNEIKANRQLPEMTDEEVIDALSVQMSAASSTLPAPYDSFFGNSETEFLKGIKEAIKEMDRSNKAQKEAIKKEKTKKAAVATAKKRKEKE